MPGPHFPKDGVILEGDDTGSENQAQPTGTRLKLPAGADPAVPLLTVGMLLPTDTVRNLTLRYLTFDGNNVAGAKLVYFDPTLSQPFYHIRTERTAFVDADIGFFLIGGFDMVHEEFHVWNCQTVGFMCGESASNVYINPNIGMVPAGAAANISSITQANPAVVTTATAHGLQDGQLVYLDDAVGGMTALAHTWGVVQNQTTTTFELKATDTTTAPAYTSGGTVRRSAVGAWVFGTNDLIAGSSTSSGGSGEGAVLWRVGYSASRSPWHTTSKSLAYCKFESCHLEAASGAMVDVCSSANIDIDGSTNCVVSTAHHKSPVNFQYLNAVNRINGVRFITRDSGSYDCHVRVQAYLAGAGRLFITPTAMPTLQSPATAGNIPIVNGLTDQTGLTYLLGRVEARVRPTANQSVPSATATQVVFDNELEDTNRAFATSAFTAPAAGLYSFTGKIYVAAGVANKTYRTQLMVTPSGSAAAEVDRFSVQASSTSPLSVPILFDTYLNAGDAASISLYHDAGSSATVSNGANTSLYVRLAPSA